MVFTPKHAKKKKSLFGYIEGILFLLEEPWNH